MHQENAGDIDESLTANVHRQGEIPTMKADMSLLLDSGIARKPYSNRLGMSGHQYSTSADRVITVVRIGHRIDEEQDVIERRRELLARRSNRDVECELHEAIIVQALLKQYDIAKDFGVSPDSLCRFVKLDYAASGGSVLMDNTFRVYMRVLDAEIENLRGQGMSDSEIVTELAGHMFHEAVHDSERGDMQKTLLGGRNSVGEVTTITAQLAYYLASGHTHAGAYATHDVRVASIEAQKKESSFFDYDLATSIAWRILQQHLTAAFSEYASEASQNDAQGACWQIQSRVSHNDRPALLQALKNAIADATNLESIEAMRRTIA